MAKNEILVSNVYNGGVKQGSATLNVIDTSLDLTFNFQFLHELGGNFYPQDDQFSPPWDRVVKAKCFVSDSFDKNLWDWWYEQPGEPNGLSSMAVTSFSDRAFYFDLNFDNRNSSWRTNFYARHKPSGQVFMVYTLRFLPSNISFPIALTGVFQGTHNLITSLKAKFPNIYLGWYRLSPVNVTVPRQLVMMGRWAGDDWASDNTPLKVTGEWHLDQQFNLNVSGAVIGYGGKGGNAGWTYVDGWVKYQFSLNGWNGGNPIHVDMTNNATRHVRIFILPGGMWEAGGGGGGAGYHSDPGRLKAWSQYGMPGSGGMPNGPNGEKSPYQRRLTLTGTQTQANDNRPRWAQHDYLAHMNYIRFFKGFSGFHETGSESPWSYQYQFGGQGARFSGFKEDGTPNENQGYHPWPTPPGPTSWGDKSDGGVSGRRIPINCTMVQDASDYNRRNLMIYHFENGATFEIEAALGPWITANLIFER